MADRWDQFQLYQPPAQQAAPESDAPLLGEDYFKSIDPGQANMARAMVEGRAIPAGNARGANLQVIREHAFNAYPNADETVFKTRAATRQNFGSGPAAKNITSLNTLMGHFNDFMETSNALNNRDFTPWNSVANYIYDKTGHGQLKDFNIARNAVSDELAKVFRSSGMSESEIERWLTSLDSSSSPDQFKSVAGRAFKLLDSRMSALASEYNRGMSIGPNGIGGLKNHQFVSMDDETGKRAVVNVGENGLRPEDLLSPDARMKAQKVKAWLYPETGRTQQAQPPQVAQPGSQQAMPQPSAQPPGAQQPAAAPAPPPGNYVYDPASRKLVPAQ